MADLDLSAARAQLKTKLAEARKKSSLSGKTTSTKSLLPKRPILYSGSSSIKGNQLTTPETGKPLGVAPSRYQPIPGGYPISKDYGTVQPSDQARLIAMPENIGNGGSYINDPSQPGKLIKFDRPDEMTPEIALKNYALRGGLSSNMFEIEHTIPIWAGGDDSLENQTLMPKSKHNLKNKVESVVRTLYYGGKLSLNEARNYAMNWDQFSDKVGDIQIDKNSGDLVGGDAMVIAENKLKEWRNPKKPGLMAGIKGMFSGDNLTKTGDLLVKGIKHEVKSAEVIVGGLATTGAAAIADMFLPGDRFNATQEGLKYARGVMEEKQGFASTPVTEEMAKGFVKGATLGWMKPTPTTKQYVSDADKYMAMASGIAGEMAGTFYNFAALQGLASGVINGAKVIPGVAGKMASAGKAIEGSNAVKAIDAAKIKLHTIINPITGKAMFGANITPATKTVFNMMSSAGLFAAQGQLSRDTAEQGNRMERLASDLTIGAVFGGASQTWRGYSSIGATTAALTYMEGGTPQEALTNAFVAMGMHGMGLPAKLRGKVEFEKAAIKAISDMRAEWISPGAKPAAARERVYLRDEAGNLKLNEKGKPVVATDEKGNVVKRTVQEEPLIAPEKMTKEQSDAVAERIRNENAVITKNLHNAVDSGIMSEAQAALKQKQLFVGGRALWKESLPIVERGYVEVKPTTKFQQGWANNLATKGRKIMSNITPHPIKSARRFKEDWADLQSLWLQGKKAVLPEDMITPREVFEYTAANPHLLNPAIPAPLQTGLPAKLKGEPPVGRFWATGTSGKVNPGGARGIVKTDYAMKQGLTNNKLIVSTNGQITSFIKAKGYENPENHLTLSKKVADEWVNLGVVPDQKTIVKWQNPKIKRMNAQLVAAGKQPWSEMDVTLDRNSLAKFMRENNIKSMEATIDSIGTKGIESNEPYVIFKVTKEDYMKALRENRNTKPITDYEYNNQLEMMKTLREQYNVPSSKIVETFEVPPELNVPPESPVILTFNKSKDAFSGLISKFDDTVKFQGTEGLQTYVKKNLITDAAPEELAVLSLPEATYGDLINMVARGLRRNSLTDEGMSFANSIKNLAENNIDAVSSLSKLTLPKPVEARVPKAMAKAKEKVTITKQRQVLKEKSKETKQPQWVEDNKKTIGSDEYWMEPFKQDTITMPKSNVKPEIKPATQITKVKAITPPKEVVTPKEEVAPKATVAPKEEVKTTEAKPATLTKRYEKILTSKASKDPLQSYSDDAKQQVEELQLLNYANKKEYDQEVGRIISKINGDIGKDRVQVESKDLNALEQDIRNHSENIYNERNPKGKNMSSPFEIKELKSRLNSLESKSTPSKSEQEEISNMKSILKEYEDYQVEMSKTERDPHWERADYKIPGERNYALEEKQRQQIMELMGKRYVKPTKNTLATGIDKSIETSPVGSGRRIIWEETKKTLDGISGAKKNKDLYKWSSLKFEGGMKPTVTKETIKPSRLMENITGEEMERQPKQIIEWVEKIRSGKLSDESLPQEIRDEIKTYSKNRKSYEPKIPSVGPSSPLFKKMVEILKKTTDVYDKGDLNLTNRPTGGTREEINQAGTEDILRNRKIEEIDKTNIGDFDQIFLGLKDVKEGKSREVYEKIGQDLAYRIWSKFPKVKYIQK